jgi:hypothetical protein
LYFFKTKIAHITHHTHHTNVLAYAARAPVHIRAPLISPLFACIPVCVIQS